MLTDATVADLNAFLRDESALLVHFSSSPKLVGHVDVLYPDDLGYALANCATYAACCSTVTPNDHFYLDGRARNGTGSIGLILRLKSEASVMSVFEDDDGSGLERPDKDVTLAECRESVRSRTAYTEWVVRDYEVIGILAVDPMEVEGREPLAGPGFEGTPAELLSGPGRPTVSLTIARIAEDFPGLPIFTFNEGGTRLWQHRKVSLDEIYPG